MGSLSPFLESFAAKINGVDRIPLDGWLNH